MLYKALQIGKMIFITFLPCPLGLVFFTGGFVSYRKTHRASNKTETDAGKKEENVNNVHVAT